MDNQLLTWNLLEDAFENMSKKPMLYYTANSPPCRSVLLTVAALGVDLDLSPTNFIFTKDDGHVPPEFLKFPHTIPVLYDNGAAITDYHVICSYLADKYDVDETLYPKDNFKRMIIDGRILFDCCQLFPCVRLMLEPVIYFGADDISQEKIINTQKAYDELEKCLTKTKYLCGDDMTIADLCCVATVSTAMLFAPIDEVKYSNVKAWVERLAALPYYQKNNGEIVQRLYNFVKEKMVENKKAKENL